MPLRSFLLVAGLLGPALAAQDASEGPPLAEGKQLYGLYCITCHGAEGKGDGPAAAALQPRPRDLSSGKFSFGNTADAIAKTVANGILPAMPAFRDSLSEAQIAAITAHVRTLMPEQVEAPPSVSRLSVGDVAKVVRGSLPPLREGGPAIAHGLIAALPGGFAFQYRSDDLRLMQVRRGVGPVLDRTDWRGRGGTPIEWMAETFWAIDGGDPAPGAWRAFDGSPLQSRLKGTAVHGDAVVVNYALVDDLQREVVQVEETLRDGDFGQSAGAVRAIRLHGATTDTTVDLVLQSSAPGEAVGSGDIPDGKGGRLVFQARRVRAGERSFVHWVSATGEKIAGREIEDALVVRGSVAPDAATTIEVSYVRGAGPTADEATPPRKEDGR